MNFPLAVKTCLGKYATFSGRASRSEYWWFVLFIVLGGVVMSMFDATIFGFDRGNIRSGPDDVNIRSDGPLSSLFSLATLLPALAAGWRRMHDTGRSGLFLLYPLIVMIGILTFMGFVSGFGPLLRGEMLALFTGVSGLIAAFAGIVLLISPLLVIWWLTRPSEPGTNQYGPNPHEVAT